MHPDLQIDHLQVGLAGKVEIGRGRHLVVIRHYEEGISFFVGGDIMKGDVIFRLFLAYKVRSGESRTRFEGKSIGSPDRGKVLLEGRRIVLFLVSATAFTGECKTHNDDQQCADERFAYQFSQLYRSLVLHY